MDYMDQINGVNKCTLVLFFLFMMSCNDIKSTKESSGETEIHSNPVLLSDSVDGDPTFDKKLDTISNQGPHSITRNVLEDRSGNIWIASWDGIIQYDGKQFTNYTLKFGLRQFHVFSMLEDSKGNLWFGTIGAGVYKYDGKYFSNFTTEHQLGGNKVFCIAEDKTGNIWLGTDNGASCFNGNTFINYTTQHGLSNNFVSTIAEDKSGKLWLGTNGGVDCYDGKEFTKFKIGADFSFTNVRSIIEDRNENIWISCQNGVFRFDGKSVTSISPEFAVCILEDKIGNIWLSGGEVTGREMILLKYNGKSLTEITRSKQIFGIIEDRTGNIWYGTANDVIRYDGKVFEDFKD